MVRENKFKPLEEFNTTISSVQNRKRTRQPFYDDNADYNTNSKSYYDYLARNQKLFELLADRIWEYDESIENALDDWDKNIEEFPHEVYKILERWLDEGKIDKYPENGKIVYTVGEKGDFDTINGAINHIEDLFSYPAEVEILILNDYVMREQVFIYDRDFSFITITCPNTVPVEISNNIKTIKTKNSASYTPFFHIVDSNSPKINAKFNQTSPYNDTFSRISGMVSENSNVIITNRKGFTGFSWGGLILLDKSNGVAIGGNFNDNGNFYEIDNPSEAEVRTIYEGKGVLVQNSDFTGDDLTAHKCGDVGVQVQLTSNARLSGAKITGCGHHSMVVSQASSVTAKNGEYTHANDDNVVCETGSNLDISYSTCSYAKYHNGLVAHKTGTIIFVDGKAENNGSWGIHAVNDGHVNAEGAVVKNNNASGVSAGRMGYVYFRFGKSLNNGQHGVNVDRISHVVAQDCEISSNGENGVTCKGGEVDIGGSTINSNGSHGVGCYSGGKVNSSSPSTKINNNTEAGLKSDNGVINMNNGEVINNKTDVRVASSGEIICNDLKTTSTSEPMYFVSSGGQIRASNCNGYANMAINIFQERGLVMSNSLKEA